MKERNRMKKKKLFKKKNVDAAVEQNENTPLYQYDIRPTLWDVIAPDGITINSEDTGIIKQTLGERIYFRPFFIPRDGYPRKMQTNWLYSLTASGEVDVLIDIHKVNRSDAVRALQKQQTIFQSSLYFQLRRGNQDQIHDLRTKIADTDLLMQEIQFNENDMFHVAVLGLIFGKSEDQLNRLSEAIEDELSGMFFKVSTTWSRVKKGFLSALPFGKNHIHDSVRNLDRRALSTFAPFISGSGRYYGGVPIGVNKITGQLEFINSFGNEDYKPPNYNMGIFGISGSGKSLAMKLKIARELVAANIRAAIIDPEGEFRTLTKRLGGINLDISEESNIVINPLAINYTDIPLDDEDEELEWLKESDDKEIIEKNGRKFIRFVPIREKQNEILDFFDIIVRGKNGEEAGLTVFERNYLEKALRYIFDEVLGITSHPRSLFVDGVEERDGVLIQSNVRKPEPTISDVYNYLVKEYGEEPKAERLIAAIRPFLRDGSKPIFDGQTNLGRGVTQALHQARLVNFNIKQMEEGFLRPIAYHVILNYLWEHFIKNIEIATEKKLLYADEFWSFIDQDQTISFFEKVARRCRKRNAGLVYASQDFLRILNNEKARGVLQNTHTFFFLEQNKIDLEQIKKNFNLTEGEIDKLFTNPEKGEGILRVGKSSVWIRTNPSDEEMIFVESNEAVLQDFLKRKQMQRSGGF